MMSMNTIPALGILNAEKSVCLFLPNLYLCFLFSSLRYSSNPSL